MWFDISYNIAAGRTRRLESAVSKTPVERQKLSEFAREQIRSRIISGEFPMGRKLPEAELVRLLGMSKSPIREALLQLEREGLIELSPSRTTRVFSMTAGEVAELGELRLTLERDALRMACLRNPATLARGLAEIVARMERALERDDVATYKALDYDFHTAIFENCGNSYAAANFHRLSFRIQALRNRLSQDPALNERSLRDHIGLRDAVDAGDTDRALAIIERHVAETTQNYLDRMAHEAAEAGGPLDDATRVDLAEMERFSRQALAAVGADAETTDAITRALMHASTLGVDTHGVRLLPHYLEALAGGRVNRQPSPVIASGNGGACVLDADNAHGARATYEAVTLAVARARQHGLGAVAIRNSSHFGAAGAYALEIARQGMMGLVFCNSDAFVRLHGGAERFHGTNPIAAAAPVNSGEPWLLDMATSSIPFNRVQLSRSLGVPLPADVASDAHGTNVIEPSAAAMLAPLGGALFGYKGAGLAGIAEILSAAFSDAPLSAELPPMISDDMATPRRLGAFVMALDPEAFAGGQAFRAVIGRYLEAIRRSCTTPGETVMAPGDREWREAERRRDSGMKLDGTTVRSLGQFARDHGIAPLRTLSAERGAEHQ
ncbi:Ldh family oxidoreductase [Psychromarinibacter sp. C21-152]|uniref:Ldh family oxidoreductase n=1 Tax=Psychromarinibacter sediminicola TaxID=3033385 RepID=A0AAE3NPW1_9RHOB|nr:Ldh family oxidoreductase [Psychromarinibacter sediminicola]MDF0600246.1 Ldh family oxidoreductase [Psychromarinibacter sediminicola]